MDPLYVTLEITISDGKKPNICFGRKYCLEEDFLTEKDFLETLHSLGNCVFASDYHITRRVKKQYSLVKNVPEIGD